MSPPFAEPVPFILRIAKVCFTADQRRHEGSP